MASSAATAAIQKVCGTFGLPGRATSRVLAERVRFSMRGADGTRWDNGAGAPHTKHELRCASHERRPETRAQKLRVAGAAKSVGHPLFQARCRCLYSADEAAFQLRGADETRCFYGSMAPHERHSPRMRFLALVLAATQTVNCGTPRGQKCGASSIPKGFPPGY